MQRPEPNGIHNEYIGDSILKKSNHHPETKISLAHMLVNQKTTFKCNIN